MHFFKVPRLGSYLAIKLEYESCLFEEALNAAVIDYIDVRQKQKEQDEEKKHYYEKLEEEKNEDEGEQTREERKWEEIKPQPFRTERISFVVCLNTLGQDREFTEEEKKLALRTARDYKDRWEQVEKDNLQQDILRRIKNIQFDKEYKEHYEAVDHQALERVVEEELLPKEGEDAVDEDTKQILAKKLRFQIMTRGFFAPHAEQAKKKSNKFKEHK